MLLAAILYSFVVSMDLPSIEWFLKSPYNLVADIKMLQYFLAPGTLTLGVIVVMVLGSIFLPGFWCRGFCPYGACSASYRCSHRWRSTVTPPPAPAAGAEPRPARRGFPSTGANDSPAPSAWAVRNA